MTSLTRSGVAYNLAVSPHKACINYTKDDSIIYTFSSNLYKEKFLEKLSEHRTKVNNSLSNRFGITFINNKLADLKLYMTIEKRGFLIEDTEEVYTCPSSIRLDGLKMTVEN